MSSALSEYFNETNMKSSLKAYPRIFICEGFKERSHVMVDIYPEKSGFFRVAIRAVLVFD